MTTIGIDVQPANPNRGLAFAMLKFKRIVLLGLCSGVFYQSAVGQSPMTVVLSSEIEDTTLELYRPRIAAAADGSFAIAWEALREGEFATEWRIGVQRFSPAGNPIGPTNYFEPESFCLDFDSWLDDGQSNVELEVAPNGSLVVLMQHWGLFDLIGDFQNSSEITLGLVDPAGNIVDLSTAGNCLQYKFIFPGADEQDRPRMALMPDATLLLTMDGFFNGSSLRNVGLDIFDSGLNDLVSGELIPHDDPSSQQAFHMWPDIATNGELFLSVWHECPIVDPQGNADECDVGAQFARITSTGVQAIGPNAVVNTGDPPGTLNWRPAAAMAPSGASVVVWQDSRTGPQGDVFGQIFDASGQAVGDNFQISAGEGFLELRPEVRPEVAMLDDGTFMVVWADSSAVGYRARGRQYTAGGMPLTAPVLLDDSPGLETGLPSVGSDGSSFYYVVLGRTSTGTVSILSNPPSSATGKETAIPGESDLILTVYPNPFEKDAAVEFILDRTATVRLKVYDLLGREIETLVEGVRGPGRHVVSFEPTGLAPGVYLVDAHVDDQHRTQLLVRTGSGR